MPRTSRPSPETLQLRVTSPPTAAERTVRLATVPLVPWPLAAAVGGAVAALVGWLCLVGVAGVAWFTASAIPLTDVLQFCAQLWLLGHGGGARIAGSTITLVPLGLTLMGVLLTGGVGRFAGGQARLARPTAVSLPERLALAGQVAGLTAVGYGVVAAAMALTGSGMDALGPVLVGPLLISGIAGLVGALSGLGLRLDVLLPRGVAAVLRGGATGAVALVALGAVVLGLALLLGADQVAAIEDGLGMDAPGRFVWAVTTMVYLPTALVWAVSWALGGGFTVGAGSLVSLSGTKLGMLPAIPLLGALPPVGAAPESALAWLAGGAVAGALAGIVTVGRLAPPARRVGSAANAALASIAAGTVTSGLLLGAAWAATGALGSLRLVELGPRLLELSLIAAPLLVMSALLAGMVRWVLGVVRAGGGPSLG